MTELKESLDWIAGHWSISLTIVGVVISIIYMKLDARYARKDDVNKSFVQQKAKHDELEERVDIVEQEIRHLPSAEDVAHLRLAITAMEGETKSLNATIKGLNRLVDLLVEKEVKEQQ